MCADAWERKRSAMREGTWDNKPVIPMWHERET